MFQIFFCGNFQVLLDMVLFWEGPTVRTQEEVPQSNLANMFAQVVMMKKKPSELSNSLFSPFRNSENKIQIKAKQVKSIYVSICFL